MNIKVDKNTVNYIYSDKAFFAEVEAFLNSVIDEEIEKADDMDTELIDECIELLSKLDTQSNDRRAVIIPMLNSKKIMNACHKRGFNNLSKGMRASLIACIVLLSALTANTVIAEVFDYNIAKEVVSSISQKLQDWGIIAGADDSTDKIVDTIPETTTQASTTQKAVNNTDKEEVKTQGATASAVKNQQNGTAAAGQNENTSQPAVNKVSVNIEKDAKPVALRLSFLSGFKTEYLWGESLDTSGLIVTAVYDGGAVKTVSTSECTFTGYNKALEGTQKIIVTYNGASETFEITLRKTTQKAEKKVTGVQASPPTKLVYTIEDTKIDLSGFRAKLIYSDGSYSGWYYSNDAELLTVVDFSQIGEQTVRIRIADKIDYEFKIVVTVPQPVIKEIEKISLSTTRFYVGEGLDDFYITVYYSNSPAEKIYYTDENSFTVLGLDTTIETLGTSKSFTVLYNGFTVSQRYTVVSRNVVMDADIISNQMVEAEPKFLYYYGEELGLGRGVNSSQIIPNLKSSQLIDGKYNFGITSDYNWKVRVHFSDSFSNTSFNDLPQNMLDFIGYDPYTLGYQLIDIFYEGMYITSMNVFVYGDEGYAPSSRAEAYTVFGKEKEQLGTRYWLKCVGDGVLSYDHRFDDLYEKYGYNNKGPVPDEILNDPWYKIQSGVQYLYAELDDENASGWQSATINMPDGTVFTYKTCHVYEVKDLDIKNAPKMLKVNIKDLTSPDFGNIVFNATLSDGTVVSLPQDDIIYAFCILVNDEDSASNNTYYGGTITENSPINSAFCRVQFSLDRNKYMYSSTYFNVVTSFCYKDGYEDFNFIVESHSSTDQDTFTVGTDMEEIKDAYDFKLQSYENFIETSNFFPITVSDLDTSHPGTYEATFTATVEGKTYTDKRTIYIVEEINTSGFQIAYDAYKGKTLLPGEELDISQSKFTYTYRNGRVIDVDSSEVKVNIETGGSGIVVENPIENDNIRVKYEYNNDYIVQYYTAWGKIKSLSFSYYEELNGIKANWTAVDKAEYYKITMSVWKTSQERSEYSYVTDSNSIVIDTNLINAEKQTITLYVTPVFTVDGEERMGIRKQETKTITIKNYNPQTE